jgi:hypothetical protein
MIAAQPTGFANHPTAIQAQRTGSLRQKIQRTKPPPSHMTEDEDEGNRDRNHQPPGYPQSGIVAGRFDQTTIVKGDVERTYLSPSEEVDSNLSYVDSCGFAGRKLLPGWVLFVEASLQLKVSLGRVPKPRNANPFLNRPRI